METTNIVNPEEKLEVIEPQTEAAEAEVSVETEPNPVVKIDETQIVIAQALVSYTASIIGELKAITYFDTVSLYKKFVESKIHQIFSVFFPGDVLKDVDINMDAENNMTINFSMTQGDVEVTDSRLAGTVFVKLA